MFQTAPSASAQALRSQQSLVSKGSCLRVSAQRAASSRRGMLVCAAKAAPPTLADTKRKFLESWKYPVPALYNGVLQELLASQHFVRHNVNYSYSPVSALGFCSVYDQLFEGFPAADQKEEIFKAFIKSLEENPDQFRKDASALTAAATAAGSVEAITKMNEVAAMKQRAEAGKLPYSKFMAIGLFRMLELVNVAEPAALSTLAEAAGLPLAKVSSDLGLYKGLLSKLSAAKELQAEFLVRERKKAEERQKEKDAKAAASSA